MELENGTTSRGVGVSQLPLDSLSRGGSLVSVQETFYSSVRIPETGVDMDHEKGTSSGDVGFSQRPLDVLNETGYLIYFRNPSRSVIPKARVDLGPGLTWNMRTVPPLEALGSLNIL